MKKVFLAIHEANVKSSILSKALNNYMTNAKKKKAGLSGSADGLLDPLVGQMLVRM